MSRLILSAGQMVQFQAYMAVNAQAYALSGATPQTAKRDIQNSLASIGTVQRCECSVIPGLLGPDKLSCVIQFAPTLATQMDSVDSKILYGANFVPQQNGGSALASPWLAVSWTSIAGDPFVVDDDSVTTALTTAAPSSAGNPLSALNYSLGIQASTVPASNGHSALGVKVSDSVDAITGGTGDSFTELKYGIIALIVIAGVIAVGYLVHNVRAAVA